MTAEVVFTYFALADLGDESIFPLIAKSTTLAAGDAFKHEIRVNELAAAGMSLDVDPLPSSSTRAGPRSCASLARGWAAWTSRGLRKGPKACAISPRPPRPSCLAGPPPARGPGPSGTTPRPPSGPMVPFNCIPSPAMLEPAKVYGWLEAGGDGAVPGKVGKARLWAQSGGLRPSRSNIRPVTMKFAQSGTQTIDASSLLGGNFYPSERHDYDAGFWSRSQTIKLAADGVSMDIDKSVITIPVYVVPPQFHPAGRQPVHRASRTSLRSTAPGHIRATRRERCHRRSTRE